MCFADQDPAARSKDRLRKHWLPPSEGNGRSQSPCPFILEEARNIMEGVRSMRLDVLGTLLKHCPRVKAVRLCLNLADELNLGWASEARKQTGPHGRGRWFGKLPDGTTLILKP